MHSSSTRIIAEDTRREEDAGDAMYMQRQRIVSDYTLCLPCVHAKVVSFLTKWILLRLAGAVRIPRYNS